MNKLFFDGACEPFNPGGIATYGFAFLQNDKIIYKGYGLACEPFTPTATNNYAEYKALIEGLACCLLNGIDSLTVFGDSQLVIKQMTGLYKVTSNNIKQLFDMAKNLSDKFNNINFIWIPREKNYIADAYSKAAFKEAIKSIDPQRVILPFGKYKGNSITNISQKDPNYLKWLKENGNDNLKRIIALAL
ncbi:MAG TPA: ribonuclease HI [Caldisericia bacterium]|nr:ribonuclease HI [Caldisericia bacterium]